MELSLIYSAFILLILLTTADPTEFDNQCPTSRRLLLFGGSNLPTGEKKTHRISSSSKTSLPSSPPKYARSGDSRGLIVFIRPQSPLERGHKGRSYSHLLKTKLYPDKVKIKIKRSEKPKIKQQQQQQLQKKDSTQQKSSIATKTQDLVAIHDQELSRCRALLHIDSTEQIQDKKVKKVKRDKPTKQAISTKLKNITNQAVKNVKKKIVTPKATISINNKKVKAPKTTKETNSDKKKVINNISNNKINHDEPSNLPVNDIPIKTSSSQSSTNTKSKRDKQETIPIVEVISNTFDTNEDEIPKKNNSVVNRAFNFVKNMFQLSDDLLENNHLPENRIIDISNGPQQQQQQQQQHHHHSRKLLTIDEYDNDNETPIILCNNTDFNLNLNDENLIEKEGDDDDNLSFLVASISKRQLLSVKTGKNTATSKTSNTKEKKSKSATNIDVNKRKVGWNYRYRISRYLDSEKSKNTGNKNRANGARKTKSVKQDDQQVNSKSNNKKANSLNEAKISKRKLLSCGIDNDEYCETDDISNPDIVNTVTIIENFVPKRSLLSSKTKHKVEEDHSDDDENDHHHHHHHKANTRREKKSFDELTDPVAIVDSYERGLFKPRVGYQFRYRVSNYINSLRENIREDQERLKLGLQAIKRKTPQELNGRSKRVLDKPSVSNSEELKKQEETLAKQQVDNRPKAGWAYRYRISRMNEAKLRGEYIDPVEEKHKVLPHDEKIKHTDHKKSRHHDTKSTERENGLDPELSQISEEGRRVGWAFRYRVRQKLDFLKKQYAETGVPFNITTLGGKRLKKSDDSKTKSTEKKTVEAVEEKTDDNKESAGWEYRYRLSNMHEAQKSDKKKSSKSEKPEKVSVDEQLDPVLAKLTPEQRSVGWQYRYRIRNKLDEVKATGSEQNQNGKRKKKSAPKQKGKKKLTKKTDNIDKTPFMDYFRRGSSYILSDLVPTTKKSICLLPLPISFSFCTEEAKSQISSSSSNKKKLKKLSKKKLNTKKEHRAKQFIHYRVKKLGADDKATERRVDEAMKRLYKRPSLPPVQTPPLPPNYEKSEYKRSNNDESLKKKIGVDSKRTKNKKQNQIIGTEVKGKNKHISIPTNTTVSTLPIEDIPTTTSSPGLRSISEVIKEEAATILNTQRSSPTTPEEINAEIEEAKEVTREHAKLKEPTHTDDATSRGEEDNDVISNKNVKK
ncbi:unnamed protein product [Adineta steineri]|uniref:Uncharacterized protein n=1 Tax=Adineta steineri TaxID=433720 RepID=A0A818S011_9BILA|nr:unnamed protein product [Adineta steineri]